MIKNDRWLFNALLVLLLWLPIPLGSNRPWAWAIMEIYSFALLLCWIGFQAQQFDYKYLKPYRPLLFIFALVQVWVFLQQVSIPIEWLKVISPVRASYYLSAGAESGSLSFDSSYTFIQWVIGCSYLAILFLTLALTRSEKRLQQLVFIMIIAGLIQALYGMYLVLTKTDHLLFENSRWVGITTGSFMYRNHLANFLMLTLSLGIGIMVANLSSSRKQNFKRLMLNLINTVFSIKALVRVSLVVMVIALVMSRSRMGNTAFFASMTICSLFALFFMKRKTSSLIWLFGSLLVIDIFIVSSWFGLEKVQERLETTSLEQETRDEVVMYGVELVKQYPFTGTGAGSFYSSFQSVQGPGISAFYDFAHNDYLQFAIEYGIPATLLLGFMVLWSFWHAQIALRSRRRSLMKGVGFAAMMAIIGQLIHISVDFTLQPPANAVYFIVILAMAWMSRYLPADRHTRIPSITDKHSES
ncbi:MAG: putative inorganic carbon (HCO3(-)) transporter [Enterobacterales bacterium]|jgi:putative inorganic carbon (HCO3(-)) transporter